MVADIEVVQAGRYRRLKCEQHSWGTQWALEAWERNVWREQYTFSLEPAAHADVELFNWSATKNPGHKAGSFAAGVFLEEKNIGVFGSTVMEILPDGSRTTRRLTSAEELRQVVTEEIGINLPGDAVLPFGLENKKMLAALI